MFVGDAQSLGFRTSSEPFDTLRERTGTFSSELIQINSLDVKIDRIFARNPPFSKQTRLVSSGPAPLCVQ